MSERLELVTVRTAHKVVDIEPAPVNEYGALDTPSWVSLDYAPEEVSLDGEFSKSDLARILILMVEAEEK